MKKIVDQSIKYYKAKKWKDCNTTSTYFDLHNIDVSDLGRISENWFEELTDLHAETKAFSENEVKPDSQRDGDFQEETEPRPGDHETAQLVVSDSWDSPRFPYTWTPGSSVQQSPDPVSVAVESRGSSKSSSPSSLALSLGVNLEGSVFSWTSSLETPPSTTPLKNIPEEKTPAVAVAPVQPKKFPRALFSPKKPPVSDVCVHEGQNMPDEEEVDALDSTIVPFMPSPLQSTVIEKTQRLPDRQKLKARQMLTSTPTAGLRLSQSTSPDQSCVIESTLSDFFDTPARGLRSRRKQAPVRKADSSVSSAQSPATTTTPLCSPLQSILSSEKKPRTPASVKRVRFADQLGNSSPPSKCARTSKGESSVLEFDQKSRDESVYPETESSELTPLKPHPDLFCHESLTAPRISEIVDNQALVKAEVLTGVLESTEVKQDITDDDMFSQISAETLKGMCSVVSEESVCNSFVENCPLVASNSIKAEEVTVADQRTKEEVSEAERFEHHHVGDLLDQQTRDVKTDIGVSLQQQTPDKTSVLPTAVTPPNSATSNKDEDLFTQISPSMMESMIDNTKTIEDLSVLETHKPTQESSSLPKSECLKSEQQSVPNQTPRAEEMSRTNRPLSLSKARNSKTKQFLYPSAKQIINSCPKRVFRFKSVKDQTVVCDKTAPPILPSIANLQCIESPNTSPQPESEMKLTSQAERLGPTNPVRVVLFASDSTSQKAKTQRRLNSDFKTFTDLMKECQDGLLDSSFEDNEPDIVDRDVKLNDLRKVDSQNILSERREMDTTVEQEQSHNLIPKHLPLDLKLCKDSDVFRSDEACPQILKPAEIVEADTSESSPISEQSVACVKQETLSLGKGTNLETGNLSIGKEDRGSDFVQGVNVEQFRGRPGFEIGVSLSKASAQKVQSAAANTLLGSSGPKETTEHDVKTLFQTGDQSEKIFVKGCDTVNSVKVERSSFSGFHTASGRNVSLSEQSLQKAQTLISECLLDKKDMTEQFLETDTSSEDKTRHSFASGFQTASGKGLTVNEQSLKKAQILVEDCSENEAQKVYSNAACKTLLSSIRCEQEDCDRKAAPCGFTTASGKGLQITDQSLSKAESFINSCLLDHMVKGENALNESNEVEQKVMIEDGFTTAGGKAVRVKNESMARAKLLLDESEQDSCSSELHVQSNMKVNEINTSRHNVDPVAKTMECKEDLGISPTSSGRKSDIFDKKYSNVPKGFRPFKPPRVTPSKAQERLPSPPHGKCDHIDGMSEVNNENEPRVNSITIRDTIQDTGFDESIADEELLSHISTVNKIAQESDEVSDKRNIQAVRRETDSKISCESLIPSDLVCLEEVFAGEMSGLPQVSKLASEVAQDKEFSDHVATQIKTSDGYMTNKLDTTASEFDETIFEELMANEATAVSQGQLCSESKVLIANSQKSLKRPRSSTSFSDDEAFQSDLERLPKEMKISLMSPEENMIESRFETKDDGSSSNGEDPRTEESSKSDLFQNSSWKTSTVADKDFQSGRKAVEIVDTSIVNESTTLKSDANKTMVQGFQTARGKSICLSEKALQKAAILLQDETSLANGSITYSISPNEEITAPVFENQEKVNKARGQSKDIPEILKSQNKSDLQSMKSISVTNDDVKDCFSVVESDFDESFTEASISVLTGDSGLPSTCVFQSMSEKSVSISQRAQDARSQLDDSSFVPRFAENCKTGKPQGTNSLFKTASGKSVNISAKALLEAKTQLENQHDEFLVPQMNNSELNLGTKVFDNLYVTKHPQYDNLMPKPVVAEVFTAHDVEQNKTKTEEQVCGINQAAANVDLMNVSKNMFQTGAGRPINISEKALQAARQIVCDELSGKENHFKPEIAKSGIPEKLPKTSSTVGDGETQARGKHLENGNNQDLNSGAKRSKTTFQTCFKKPEIKPGDKKGTTTQQPVISSKISNFGSTCMFQTCSGKPVNISEKALQAARKCIGDDSSAIESETTNQKQPSACSKTVSFGSMFQTCSGKPVNVSEKALQAARQCIGDDSSEIKSGTTKQKQPSASSKSVSFGSMFQTCSGKPVNISEKALQAARQCIGDDSSEIETETTNQKQPIANSKTAGFNSMFQICSGKPVNVSEKALQAARQCIGDSLELESETTNGKQPSASSKTASFSSMFQTCSGKPVNVSEKALRAAREYIGDESSKMETVLTDQKQPSASSKTVSFGSMFQTCSGKPVNISEKALQAARQCIGNESSDLETETTDPKQPSAISKSISFGSMFQTCSGKPVKVSEKALQAARQCIGNESSDMETETTDQKQPSAILKSISFGSMFQTCSGKPVNISEKALQAARQCIRDDSSEMDSDTTNLKQPSACSKNAGFGSMFKTCSEKPVSISEKALEEARKCVRDSGSNDEEFKENQNDKPTEVLPSSSSSIGGVFQTCSGKAVDVSKNALEEARRSVEDENRKYPRMQPCRLPVLSSDVDNTSEDTNGMSFISTRTSASVYKRRPMYSTPEGSLRDHPYRRGKNFAARKCGDTTNFSANSREDTRNPLAPIIAGNASTGPSSVPDKDEGSVFKPPYKPEAVSSGFSTPYKSSKTQCEKTAPTINETGEGKASFNPFTPGKINSKEAALLYEEEPQTNKAPTKSKKVCASSTIALEIPKHVPDCSGDNVRIPDTELSKIAASPESVVKNSHKGPTFPCSLSKEAIANLQMARLQQDKLISRKKRISVRPCAGKLLTQRNSYPAEKRCRLETAMGADVCRWNRRPGVRMQNVPAGVRSVSSGTAEDFRFDLISHYGSELMRQGSGVLVGDGIKLLPADDCTAGKAEFYRAFVTHENVDPKLISEAWLFNHYRWIVWKLAAYEVYNPVLWVGRSLTPDNVMLQLKYRYDREIDKCERPALRRILEHDDSAGKRLVLCVSAIITGEGDGRAGNSMGTGPGTPMKDNSQVCLEVTDGWYCMRASLDTPLVHLVRAARVRVGDKLVIFGAELTGSQDPTNPLDAPTSVGLKLCANSVRRARWDCRLGYQADPRPFPLPVSGLMADGGTVPAVDVVVVRVYPTMYFEKVEGGQSVFRNARAEQRAEAAYRRGAERLMEQLYNKLQGEMERQEEQSTKGANRRGSRKRLSAAQIEGLSSGAEIYEAVTNSLQPDAVEMALSSHQVSLLHQHRQSLADQKRQKLEQDFQKALQDKQQSQPVRNVVPVLKVRVAGCHLRDLDSKLTCMLTVWRPSEDVLGLLSEGRKLRIYNLSVSAARSRLTDCTVQLTASRSTRYQESAVDENFLDQVYEPREVLSVRDLHTHTPIYGEVDFVGVVLKVGTSDYQQDRGCQLVYAADVHGGHIVIRVWGSLQSLHLEDVLVEGGCFVGSNLLYRGRRYKQLVTLDMSTEVTHFTRSPANKIFIGPLSHAKTKVKDAGYMRRVTQALEDILGTSSSSVQQTSYSEGINPQPVVLKQSELLSPSSSTHPTANLPGPTTPDCESARKSLLQTKKDKLSRYSGAPPLSPLAAPIPNTVRKAFRPPRRQSTPS